MTRINNHSDFIAKAIADSDYSRAIALYGEAIDAAADPLLKATLYFERGKLYWKTGCRSAATTDYAAAAELDPDGPAVAALDQAREIENFFNTDLLNP
ncbi:MAG: hypothetical protein K2F71_04585 [Paramuribaculum sp.]|nr:hypothetical protein [Paramuribaculum sp.]